MTASGHSVPAKHLARLRFMPAVAAVKRAVRQHPVLIAAAVLLPVAGGATTATLALTQSNGYRPAATCPGASAYAYEVPTGMMFRKHPLHIGERVRINTGGPWRVTAIAALPNDCEVAANGGGTSGTIAGRLILQPVR